MTEWLNWTEGKIIFGCVDNNWLDFTQGLRHQHKIWALAFIYISLGRIQILPLFGYGSTPEKAMAPHSSTLAWRIPWTEEPGRLQSMGSLRVGLDWATSLSLSCIGEEMATYFGVLAWRIPGTGEPGGLPSVGSHRVRHDWSDLAAAAALWVSFPVWKSRVWGCNYTYSLASYQTWYDSDPF